MAAPAALRGLENLRVVRSEERSLPALVPVLAAGLPPRAWARRGPLYGGRIGGRGPRRVSGVLIQAALQVDDLLLQGLDLGPQLGRLSPQR